MLFENSKIQSEGRGYIQQDCKIIQIIKLFIKENCFQRSLETFNWPSSFRWQVPRLHLAPARGFDPRGESDSPFSPNVNANHQPREAGLTRLFCPSKKVGFDPRAGSDTAIFCSVNRKPSLPRRLIANFRWRSRASFELRFSTHTVPYTKNCVSWNALHQLCARRVAHTYRPATGYIA